MKVVLYARVSTEEQATGDAVSINEQIADMEKLCDRNDWQIANLFVDKENYLAVQTPKKGKVVNPSGERADRPAFLEMLKEIQTGHIDAILCWRDDRLVRHPRVAIALEEALDLADIGRNGRGKVQIYEATGAPIDRFTLGIKAQIWREENKRRVERVKLGKMGILKAGRWPGRYGRYGYKEVREQGRRGIEIVEVPEESAVVKEIFHLYDSGQSVNSIRKRLVARDVDQKRAGITKKHQWAKPIVNAILRSEAYTGQATWNFGDGTSYTIPIPKIIEPELFKRVQKRLERNKELSARNTSPDTPYLLQGIAYCGECGGKLRVRRHRFTWGSRRKDGTRKKYEKKIPLHEYLCQVQWQYPEENHPKPAGWYGRTLDDIVWRKVVDNVIKNPKIIEEYILDRQAQLQAQGESLHSDISRLRQRLNELDQEELGYTRQQARGKITEKVYDLLMAECNETRQTCKEELQELLELRDNAEKTRAGLEYMRRLVEPLQAELPDIDLTMEQIKALPEAKQVKVLKKRQKFIRAFADKVLVFADGSITIEGVLDGSEAEQFELDSPGSEFHKILYTLLIPPVNTGAETVTIEG